MESMGFMTFDFRHECLALEERLIEGKRSLEPMRIYYTYANNASHALRDDSSAL